MTAPFKNKSAPAKLSSLQAALDRAYQEDPGTTLSTFALPGTPFASPGTMASICIALSR